MDLHRRNLNSLKIILYHKIRKIKKGYFKIPLSTSTGRAVKGILDDVAFRQLTKDAKSRTCNIVDKLLVQQGNTIINEISSKNWDGVYKNFTLMRRLIEIKEESCK